MMASIRYALLPGLFIGGLFGLTEASLLYVNSSALYWDSRLFIVGTALYAGVGAGFLMLLRMLVLATGREGVPAKSSRSVAAALALFLVLFFGVTGIRRGWHDQLSSLVLPNQPGTAWAITTIILFFLIFFVAAMILSWVSRKPILSPLLGTRFMIWGTSLVIGLSLISSLSIASELPIPNKESPNILLIVMDTSRADALSISPNRHPLARTPHMDQLAKEGTLFTRAYAQAPWTLESHASILTGLYSSQHGACRAEDRLHEEYTTLAEYLQSTGYQTVGFANNAGHVNKESGLAQGFEEWYPMWKTSWSNAASYSGSSTHLFPTLRLEVLIRLIVKPKNSLAIPANEVQITDEGAQVTTLMARRWLSFNHAKDRPFFMFINYMEPHHPYRPPLNTSLEYPDISLLQAPPLETEADAEMWNLLVSRHKNMGAGQAHSQQMYCLIKCLTGEFEVSDRFREVIQALYMAEVQYLDSEIGKLLDYLRANNIMDNTLVVITADHGEHLGEHKLWVHEQFLYDELIRVPLIVRYPKLFPPNTRRDDPVELIDLFPTVENVLDRPLSMNREQRFGVSLLEAPNPERLVHSMRGFVPEPNLLGLTRIMNAYQARKQKEHPPTKRKEGNQQAAPPTPSKKPPRPNLEIAQRDEWLKKNWNVFAKEETHLIWQIGKHYFNGDLNAARHYEKELDQVFHRVRNRWSIHMAVISQDWKYNWNSCDTNYLFNLQKDPDENINVLDNNPELTTSFHRIIEKWLNKQNLADVSKTASRSDEDIHEAKALGYIK